jgi:hypothetical protein
VVVDEADTRRLADVLIRNGVLDPKVAYKVALISQGAMTAKYAREYAKRVRRHVEWAAAQWAAIQRQRPN